MKKTSFSRRLRRISGLLVLLAGWAAASGQVIYVDADAPGAGDGTSWENAYNFLQDALADARTTGMEIWVAQGVYTPDSNSAFPEGTGDREASFEPPRARGAPPRGATLRGGYAGFRGSDPNARDAGSYETILSGDLGHNDGPDFANYDENSYHVVLALWTGPYSLDGFTITGGNATGTGGFTVDAGTVELDVGHDSGGGVYNSYNCSATITNCIFHKNKATWGAGMYNNGDYGNATLTNCVFSDNTAFGGGGMFTGGFRNFRQDRYCTAQLDNCTFERNSADLGGGMYSQSYLSDSTLTNCNFVRNTATFYGGGIHNDCGSLKLTGCDFVGNSTLVGSGLIGGGAVYSINAAPLRIANCIFSGNASAAVGGAIYAGSCRPGTNAGTPWTTCGGGLGLSLSTSTFVGNKAANCGGAICLGIGRSALANCILWGNIAPQGKEMAIDPHNIETAISNSDVEGGGAGVFYMDPDCRDREPCPGDPNCDRCSLVWQWNMDADPCFADPGYWHTNGTPDDPTDDFWVNGDYHLKSETGRWDPNLMSWVQDYVSSPCIDTGHPNIGPAQEPLPHAGIINMGAFSGTAEASKACFSRSSCGILIEGDLNGDCLINGSDLAIMARHWIQLLPYDSWCDAFLAGDMDYTTVPNRRIDFRDFCIMAMHWRDDN